MAARTLREFIGELGGRIEEGGAVRLLAGRILGLGIVIVELIRLFVQVDIVNGSIQNLVHETDDRLSKSEESTQSRKGLIERPMARSMGLVVRILLVVKV
jgi:hypothetical protein